MVATLTPFAPSKVLSHTAVREPLPHQNLVKTTGKLISRENMVERMFVANQRPAKSVQRLYKTTLWLAFIALCFGTTLLTGCKQRASSKKKYYGDLPDGWSLEKKRATLLGRSYPHLTWATLILRMKSEQGLLFTTGFPKKPIGIQDIMGFFQSTRQTRRAPGPSIPGQRQKQQARRRPPRPNGFSFVLRSSKAVTLQLRLYTQNRMGETQSYQTVFQLPKTGRRWKTFDFLYDNFDPVLSRFGSARLNTKRLIRRIEFWEMPGKSKKTTSVTLTLKGPFPFMMKKKHRKKRTHKKTNRSTPDPNNPKKTNG